MYLLVQFKVGKIENEMSDLVFLLSLLFSHLFNDPVFRQVSIEV